MIFQKKKNKIRKYAITRKFPQLLDENDVFLHKKKTRTICKIRIEQKVNKKTKYLETLEWLGFLVKTSAILCESILDVDFENILRWKTSKYFMEIWEKFYAMN